MISQPAIKLFDLILSLQLRPTTLHGLLGPGLLLRLGRN